MSRFLKNLSLGIDNSPVRHVEYKELPKSIGHQHTLAKNTRNPKILKSNLHRLSDMVGKRLRKNKMVGRTISMHLRDSNFKGYNERTTINPATDSTAKIYETIQRLFDRINWDKETRLVGVGISNLELKELTPLPLFERDLRSERKDEVIDALNDKFGEFTVIPANTLLADRAKGKISSFLRH